MPNSGIIRAALDDPSVYDDWSAPIERPTRNGKNFTCYIYIDGTHLPLGITPTPARFFHSIKYAGQGQYGRMGAHVGKIYELLESRKDAVIEVSGDLNQAWTVAFFDFGQFGPKISVQIIFNF